MDEKRIKVKVQVTIPVCVDVEVSFDGDDEDPIMTIHGGDLSMMGQPSITERFLTEHLSEESHADIEEIALEAWRKSC